MVGMVDAAIKELDSSPWKPAESTFPKSTPYFAKDVFLYLRDQEQKVEEVLREPPPGTLR